MNLSSDLVYLEVDYLKKDFSRSGYGSFSYTEGRSFSLGNTN